MDEEPSIQLAEQVVRQLRPLRPPRDKRVSGGKRRASILLAVSATLLELSELLLASAAPMAGRP
jgi:hypothetical protein